MASLDLSKPVDVVRLAIADYQDPEVFDDTMLRAILDKNDGNEAAAIKEAASYMLGALSRQSRMRLDRIEIMGSEAFNNYLTYLKYTINNPATGVFAAGGIYVGGVDTTDFYDNRNDATVIQKRIPSYNDCPTDLDELF